MQWCKNIGDLFIGSCCAINTRANQFTTHPHPPNHRISIHSILYLLPLCSGNSIACAISTEWLDPLR